MRQYLAQLQVAIMLLTRLPAGQLPAAIPSMGQAAWAFPIVGLLIGGICAGVLLACAGLPAPLLAGVVVAAGLLVTGALHEDGLADLADGFGGGRDAARKLEIMRDSRIGSYGTIALIMALGLRAAALALMIPQGLPQTAIALVAIETASRAGLPLVMWRVRAARADGLGNTAAAGIGPWRVLFAAAIGAGALLLLGLSAAIILGGVMALVLLAMSLLALRQIGGQTGDVLGAMQQISALAAWLVLSIQV